MIKFQFVKDTFTLNQTLGPAHIIVPLNVYPEGWINRIVVSRRNTGTVLFNTYLLNSLAGFSPVPTVFKQHIGSQFVFDSQKKIYTVYYSENNSDLFVLLNPPAAYKCLPLSKPSDYNLSQTLYLIVSVNSLNDDTTFDCSLTYQFIAR